MTTSSFSTMNELDAAIKSHNPFSGATIDKAQSIWGKGYPDLPSLNAKASQRVLDTIKYVQSSQNSKDKVATLVITGAPGYGKTQIIGRLRRRVISDGTALFIYANVAKYGDLKLVRYQFLRNLVEELARIGSQGVTQWQEVAAAIANASNPTGKPTPVATIVKNFDKTYARMLENNHNLIKKLSDRILQTKSDADPYILRAMLWTLSEGYAPYAVEWLAGNELDQSTADTMGLPTNANKTAQDKEAEAIAKINKILRLVGDYKPLLICFDELDPDKLDPDTGTTLPQVIAYLIKNIYDNLEQSSLGQGVVILTTMFEAVWANHLKNTSLITGGSGVLARMSTATQSKPISLQPLNEELILDLVALWLQEELYKPQNLEPHDPVYPFTKNELIDIGKGKPTVREALNWCAEHWPKDKIKPEDRFKQAVQEADAINKANITTDLEDNAKIAGALRFGFENLIGHKLEGATSTGQQLNQVIIDSVETVNDQWITLKVSGTETNNKFAIGIAVIQKSGSIEVKKGLIKSLNNQDKYTQLGITRGCLVRSANKTITQSTQAYQELQKFINQMSGEWVFLELEPLKSLINFQTVYENCQSYYLNTEQVKDFSKEEISKNQLLLEIISDPSGQINPNTIAAGDIFVNLFDESTTDDGADSNEGNELFSD